MIKDNQPQTVKTGFIVLNRLITSARKEDFINGLEVCLEALQLSHIHLSKVLFLVQNNQKSLYALNVLLDFQELTLKVLKKIKSLKMTDMFTLYLSSNSFIEVIVTCF